MNLDRLNKPQRMAAICMAVVALSAFLPWASLFGISISGIRGDGRLTLVLALVGLAVLAISTEVLGPPKLAEKPALIVLAIASVLTALVGLADMSGVAALGLYLTLFGGIGWVVATAWDWNLRKSGSTETSAEDQPTT